MGSALGLRVKFKGTTLQEFSARYLVDVGPTGMFIRTDRPLAVGSRVRFEFALENDAPLLGGEAVVVWVAEENKELNLPSGMELRFDALAPDCESRFHWLQMQKRGVNVGREMPVSVSTSGPGPGPGPAPGPGPRPGPGMAGAGASASAAGAAAAEPGPTSPANAPANASANANADPSEANAAPASPPTGAAGDLKRRTLPLGVPALKAWPPDELQSVDARHGAGDDARDGAGDPSAAASVGTHLPVLAATSQALTTPTLDSDGDAPPLPLPPPQQQPEPHHRRAPADAPEELAPGESDPGRLFHEVVEQSRPSMPELGVRRAKPARAGANTHEQLRDLRSTGARNVRKTFLWGVVAGAVVLLGWVVYQSIQPTQPTGERPVAVAGGRRPDSPRAVRLVSEPSGAEVLLEGRLLGTTPLIVEVQGRPRLLVQLAGYVSESLVVAPESPGWAEEAGRLVLPVRMRLQRAAGMAQRLEAKPDAAAPPAPRLAPGVVEPKTKAHVQAKANAKPTAKAKASVEPRHRGRRGQRHGGEREAPETKLPAPEVKPEPKPEPRPEPKPEPRPEPKPEPRPGPRPPPRDLPSPEDKKDVQKPATKLKRPSWTQPKVKNPDWVNK